MPRGRPALNPDKNALLHMYVVEGLTLKQVAYKLNTTAATISHYLRKYDIPRRSGSVGQTNEGRAKNMAKSEPRRSEMKALYAGGMTLQKIAAIYGITRQRVHQIVNHNLNK